MRIACILALVAMLAACGSGGAQKIPRLDFGYDTSAPLEYQDRGVLARTPRVAVHDVSFSSGGRRIQGLLIVPPGSHRRPAVVFVHSSGGDRQELLAPAAALAARGLVALTLTEPSASPSAPAGTQGGRIRQQRDLVVSDVVAVRRAVDALRTLPQVDPARVGYLGWSAGGRLGTFVTAADPRVRALVLLSAGADPVSRFVAHSPKALRGEVRSDLGSVDPLRYIPRARGAVLLEDGTKDKVVPHEALVNVIHAAPKGTRVRWYSAGHALNRQAYEDAFAWLQQRLG
jgi:cephalosporin-C deacetylase-like acetyl esterase